jgi:DNA-binding CsgD family transcriptional regulator
LEFALTLDAFHLSAVGTRDDLRQAVQRVGRGSPEEALLTAVVAQYDGDVEGAVRILRRQLRAPGDYAAALADMLAPILIMRHENDAVEPLARTLEDGGWVAAAHSFRALAAADTGNQEAARKHAAAAHAALPEERNEVVRFRVLQRLARTAFYLDEYEKAVDLALASAGLCSRMGAWRAAAAGYSIAYNVHHNVTGDAGEADRFARLWRDAAAKSGDESFLHAALVAEYELAVQLAELPRIAALERLIQERLLPQQYTERFPLAFSHALVRGAADLVVMRTLLQVLRDTPGRSPGQWALCTALIAVSEAARADDDTARHSLRAAVQRLGRASAGDPAYERRYRRLARAAVAAACTLLGDDVRAARTIAARESREGQGEDRLPALMRSGKLHDALPALRGIARVFAAAFEQRRALDLPAGLTSAEFAVLRLLANGWSAGRIARETDRSVNTVYSHTRSILEKLQAARASEAVAIARARGLLT